MHVSIINTFSSVIEVNKRSDLPLQLGNFGVQRFDVYLRCFGSSIHPSSLPSFLPPFLPLISLHHLPLLLFRLLFSPSFPFCSHFHFLISSPSLSPIFSLLFISSFLSFTHFLFFLVKVSCFFSIFFGIPCESLSSCHWNLIDYIDLCLSVFRFAAKLIAGVLDFKTMIDKWVLILKCGFYSVMFSRDEILHFNEITWYWIGFNHSNRSMQ